MVNRKRLTLKAGEFSLKLGKHSLLMAVMNMTLDSFSDDGLLKKRQSLATLVSQAYAHVKQGANILDIGGESTRPNAKTVRVDVEIERVLPLIKALKAKNFPIPISIDTYKDEVAIEALKAGASIVNTIQGPKITLRLLKAVKEHGAAIVLMHMRGTPQSMSRLTRYQNLTKDILQELAPSIEKCLEIGLKKDRIIIDPGIGFAKTVEQNLEILNDLTVFKKLGLPILVGVSRKSFIGAVLNKDVQGRLFGTAAATTAAIGHGAHIIRVHDTQAMRETADMADAIYYGLDRH